MWAEDEIQPIQSRCLGLRASIAPFLRPHTHGSDLSSFDGTRLGTTCSSRFFSWSCLQMVVISVRNFPAFVCCSINILPRRTRTDSTSSYPSEKVLGFQRHNPVSSTQTRTNKLRRGGAGLQKPPLRPGQSGSSHGQQTAQTNPKHSFIILESSRSSSRPTQPQEQLSRFFPGGGSTRTPSSPAPPWRSS